jgi:hypothetical protein
VSEQTNVPVFSAPTSNSATFSPENIRGTATVDFETGVVIFTPSVEAWTEFLGKLKDNGLKALTIGGFGIVDKEKR